MKAILIVGSVALLTMSLATAQSSGGGSSTPNYQTRQPSVNVRIANVRARAPGNWVNNARARHTNGSTVTPATGESNGGSSGGGGLTDLLQGLLNDPSFAGLIGAGGLDTILGGGAGGGTVRSGGDAAVGSGGGSADGNGGVIGENGGNSTLPPEVIEMLEAAGIDPDSISVPAGSARTIEGSRGSPPATVRRSAAGAALRKPGLVAQSTNPPTIPQDEPRFVDRLASSLATTFFASLTLAFRTPTFIEALEDILRPIVNPAALIPVEDEADETVQDETTQRTRDASGSKRGSTNMWLVRRLQPVNLTPLMDADPSNRSVEMLPALFFLMPGYQQIEDAARR